MPTAGEITGKKGETLEKAFDRIPREVVKWAMRKLGVDEWLIRAVMTIYRNSDDNV